ncbi:hypothetical protein Tco_0873288 [Tanacetum coccineum]
MLLVPVFAARGKKSRDKGICPARRFYVENNQRTRKRGWAADQTPECKEQSKESTKSSKGKREGTRAKEQSSRARAKSKTSPHQAESKRASKKGESQGQGRSTRSKRARKERKQGPGKKEKESSSSQQASKRIKPKAAGDTAAPARATSRAPASPGPCAVQASTSRTREGGIKARRRTATHPRQGREFIGSRGRARTNARSRREGEWGANRHRGGEEGFPSFFEVWCGSREGREKSFLCG